jgi:hypothetical protein
MAERAEEERRDPAADAVAVAVYSVLVLLLMLAWTDVPASRLEGQEQATPRSRRRRRCRPTQREALLLIGASSFSYTVGPQGIFQLGANLRHSL